MLTAQMVSAAVDLIKNVKKKFTSTLESSDLSQML